MNISLDLGNGLDQWKDTLSALYYRNDRSQEELLKQVTYFKVKITPCVTYFEVEVIKMTGGTPEVRSNKSTTLLTFEQ